MLVCVATPKTRMVNVRLTEKVHEDFKIACELRGVSMSSLMHQFVVRTIREEREMDPRAFERPTTSRENGMKVPPASRSPRIPLVNPTEDLKRRTNDAPRKKKKNAA